MNRRGALASSPGAAGPVTGGGWREMAACRGADPDLFFPPNGIDPLGDRVRAAKAACARCPVRGECLAAGKRGRETGVWGGELFEAGRLIREPRTRQPRRRLAAVPREDAGPERCRNKHVRTEENTRRDNTGRLVCRECQAARCRRYRQEAA